MNPSATQEAGGVFDFDDRLVTRNQTGNNESWTLSQVGNWNTYTLNGTGTNRTHGAAHEVATVGANSVTHDSRGNITQSETGKKYAWDFDGHMSNNDGDGNNTADVTYAYDALGRRVSRAAGGSTLVFCSLKHDTIGEYTSGSAPGSPQRTYIHYTPYGDRTILDPPAITVRTSSSIGNVIGYTGQRHDAETTLCYFRARMMHSRLGRFIGRDPLLHVDGPDLYIPYFVPTYNDASGTCKCPGGNWTYNGTISGGAFGVGYQ